MNILDLFDDPKYILIIPLNSNFTRVRKNGLGHFKGQINILPDKKAKPVRSKELCIDMCTSGFSDLPPPQWSKRRLKKADAALGAHSQCWKLNNSSN